MKCCIKGRNFIRLLFLLTELFKFEIQKCGQILCAHIKPYFSCRVTYVSTKFKMGHFRVKQVKPIGSVGYQGPKYDPVITLIMIYPYRCHNNGI